MLFPGLVAFLMESPRGPFDISRWAESGTGSSYDVSTKQSHTIEGYWTRNRNHYHRDSRNVGLIIHHDPIHTTSNVRVHVRNSANPIHDDDLQCLRVPNHNHELCLRFRTVFVRDVHSPTIHVHDVNEWTIGNDAALYTDIVSVVLRTSLFVIVRASDQSG